MHPRGVSLGIATITGTFARAPYAANAPAALPAEGALSAVTPNALATETASVIPRALNEPVGFLDSSFIQTRSETWTRGVHPSFSETSPEASGSTSRYRQSVVGRPARADTGSVVRSKR